MRWSRRIERGTELILAVDPVAERRWFWRPEEWFVWESLTVGMTRKRLRELWEARFAPRRISPESLQRILAKLLDAGLIHPLDAAPDETLARRQTAERRARGAWWSKILAWRGPGFAPRALQRALRPFAVAAYSRIAGGVLAIAVACATWIVVTQRTRLAAESAAELLPRDWRGIVAWGLVLAVVKAWHELGHLAAATACGVRARRVGVMLLCGVPTLYCVIDDAWRASRRARLLIDAGGMLFEGAAAVAALFVWNATLPGAWHDLALRVAVLGGVNTLLLNGNPLLRYDGYFLLSDATAIPNLGQQASGLAAAWFARLLGRAPETRDPPLQHHDATTRGWLIAYALASVVYRWTLAWGMIWFVHRTLRPYGWTSPSYVLGFVFFVLFLWPPIQSMRTMLKDWTFSDDVRRRRFGLRSTIAVASLAGLVFIPWPASTDAPILWESPDAAPLAAVVSGRLRDAQPAGTSVAKNDPVVVLENPELEQAAAKAAGEATRAAAHLDDLRLRGTIRRPRPSCRPRKRRWPTRTRERPSCGANWIA
ncbi:MAG: hypothetical protein QM811_04850 [Pirellulales bacterium]